MNGSSSEVTRVRIYNQSYDLKGEDPEQIRKLAGLLDEKMGGIAKGTPTVDTVKIAILAALTIADDYFAARARVRELEAEIGEETEKLLGKLRGLGIAPDASSSDDTMREG